MLRTLLLLPLLLALEANGQEKAYFPDPDPLVQERLADWRDLKFGLLMHWGPYSQWGIVESWSICPEDVPWAAGGRKPGVADDYEDYRRAYEALPRSFDPAAFDPSRWAAAAEAAGMRYVVFTTKHHDGFCMFDSKLTDYKITDPSCPFSARPRANVTREIFDAFRAKGFWTGAYFSKPDWHSDDYWWRRFPPADRNCNYQISKYPERWQRFTHFTHGQVEELMRDYGKVDILWLDGGWVRRTSPEEVETYRSQAYEGVINLRFPQDQDIDIATLARKARALQPGLIVVDRACPGPYQNYLTPEQHIPDEGLPYPWETCMTMGDSWSFVPGDNYKSTATLLRNLVDVVSKGGNFLLNVGPGPDGDWDPVAYSRLEEIGAWMKVHGEAIYGSTMHDAFGEGEHVRYTVGRDGRTRYIFLLDIPEGELELTKLHPAAGSVLRILGSGRRLSWNTRDGVTRISLPRKAKEEHRFVTVVEVGGS